MPLQAPRGTRDFYPEDMAVRRHIEAAWRRVSICHGYEEVDGPTFEHLELYTLKSGEGIVSELFSFTRAGGDDVYALRPEFTPTLARMVAARAGSLPSPLRWFALPNFFRAERPQRGRLREFYQWNVDLIGAEGAAADAELIAVAVAGLERLGLGPGDVQVRISHRHAVARLLSRLGVPEEHLGAAFDLLDRRDRIPPEEFMQRAVGLGLDAAAVERFGEIGRTRTAMTRPLEEMLGGLEVPEEDIASLAELREALADAGIAEWCQVDLGIVRGLAYYTGTVFEVHEASGAERAVAGGGRYDGLIELFGGPKRAAVGFGMGDVVLGLVLEERGLLGGKEGRAALLPRPDLFVISAGGEEADRALRELVRTLRRRGLHVRHSSKATRNVGKLLGEASKVRSRCAAILGAELAEGKVALKDLESGVQRLVPLDQLEQEVRALAAPSDAGG